MSMEEYPPEHYDYPPEHYEDCPEYSPAEVAAMEEERQKWEKALLHEKYARTHLSQYETWESTTPETLAEDIKGFESILERSEAEADVQKFLEEHPSILTHPLGGGHGRYCISKPSLGGRYIPDFLLADLSSIGLEWYGVELENPRDRLFTRSTGDPSAKLSHAIRQIRDWRDWLKHNLDEARRPREHKGLGLIDIEPELKCYILIGRRVDLNTGSNDLRRRMNREANVEIHTYDWLVQHARNILALFGARQ